MYKMFFMGRNFVDGAHCTLNRKNYKNVKT